MAKAPEGLYLIRHGHTQLNSTDPSKDLIRGWKNVPLDAEGEKESKAAASFVADKLKPVIIYSSDLDRAANGAKEAAKAGHTHLKISDQFRPWNLGEFQGQPAEKVVPQLQQYLNHPEKPVPGGGESFNAFRSRVIKAVKQAMQRHLVSGENVVVFTHFRVLKLVQAWLAHPKADAGEEIHAETFTKNDIPTGAMLRVYRERGKWKTKVEYNPKIGVKRSDAPRIGS